MNKKELAKALAGKVKETGVFGKARISNDKLFEVLTLLEEVVFEELATGQDVKLGRLGTYKLTAKPARAYKLPKKDAQGNFEMVEGHIEARASVKFSLSEEIKRTVKAIEL